MNETEYKSIFLKHYSSVHPIRSTLISNDEKFLKIHVTNEIIKSNYLLGDPVVVHMYEEKAISIFGTIIDSVEIAEKNMKLKICDFETIPNKRRYDRHPVSYYIDIKYTGINKRIIGTVRNICYEGMLLLSKEDFDEDSTLGIDLYTENNVLSLRGAIIRKKVNNYNYEYGIKVMYPTHTSREGVKKIIYNLEKEHDELLYKLQHTNTK
jgi:hypothetical protein